MIVTLHFNHETAGTPAPERRLDAAVRAALATGVRGGREVDRAEISVTLLSAEAMRVLNRDYHAVDGSTDVLAFALDPDPGPHGDEASVLGDVYICPDIARATADDLGIELEEEVLRLAIHGVLHLLGHDHPAGPDRYESEMFALQERLLASLAG